MNFINSVLEKFFGIKDKEVKSDFSIEFYPLTGRYYPKYKDYYLEKDYITGIVEKIEPFLFIYADYGISEEAADHMITMFKEHQLKFGVKIIKR